MAQPLVAPSAAQFQNTSNHLDALQALRGFACLAIVIFHCAAPRNAIVYKNYDLSWLLFSHGIVAVWIFFGLSGYLMGKVFYTERYTTDVSGVLNFWRNRLLRICPLYYFALLISCIFVYPVILKLENWGSLVRILTFTYNQVLPPADFNITFWAISSEVQFYLIVPFVYNLFRYRLLNKKQILLAAGAILAFSFFLRLGVWIALKDPLQTKSFYYYKYTYNPVLTNLDVFLLGFFVNTWIYCQRQAGSNLLVFSKLRKKLRLDRLPLKTIAIGLMIVLYLFTAHHIYFQELWRLPGRGGGIRTSTFFFVLPVLTAIITAFFIYAFESGNSYWAFKNNEKLSFYACLKNPLRILEIFGHLSYGIYIWHTPINKNIAPIFTSEIPIEAFYSRLTATLILSTVLAAVTYYLVEIPAGRLKTYKKS